MRRHRSLEILLFFCALLAWVFVRAEGAKPVIPDDVKATLQARIDAGETAGIVVGWVDAGGEVFASAGVVKTGRPQAVDPDTIFEIGSITKSFTGTVLADMVRRGEVKLDDPVKKYLPKNVSMPKDAEREITLLDLATHQSGLPRLPDNMSAADPDDPYVDYTAERLYTYLGSASLTRKIGSAYEYSNLGAGLLGHALTRAAKTDYETLVKQRITIPLGMKSTSIQIDPAAQARVASGYEESEGKLVPAKAWTFKDSSVLAGAGALRSTARDMIRYVAANAGLVETKLAPAFADAQSERADGNGPGMTVGLGWQRRQLGDRIVIWHNGGTGGFHAFCAFDPIAKNGVVVLSNSTADIDDIGLHMMNPSRPFKEVFKPVAVEEAKLARLDGWYDLGDAKLRITHEGAQLFAQYTGQGRYPVFAKSESMFVYRVVPASLEFDIKGDGTVTQVTLHQGQRNLPAKRMSAETAPKERVEIPVDPKVLAEYAGSYRLTPSVILTIKVADGHLTVQLTGQPAFDAYAETPTDFFLKKVDAQLTFARSAEGKVESVTLHQAGTDQKATRVGK